MMWKSVCAVALAAAAVGAQAQSKQELVAKLLQLQQPALEGTARRIVERPALQLMQAAGNALQTRVPAEKREAAGKSIEADVRKFVDDSVPSLQKRAVEIAPTTLGTELQEKFSEEELKQLIAWFDSPVNRKYQQVFPPIQEAYTQKLAAEAGTLLDARLQTLQQKVQATLASAQNGASGAARPNGPASAQRPGAAGSAARK